VATHLAEACANFGTVKIFLGDFGLSVLVLSVTRTGMLHNYVTICCGCTFVRGYCERDLLTLVCLMGADSADGVVTT
jgi:hypothetical protein